LCAFCFTEPGVSPAKQGARSRNCGRAGPPMASQKITRPRNDIALPSFALSGACPSTRARSPTSSSRTHRTDLRWIVMRTSARRTESAPPRFRRRSRLKTPATRGLRKDAISADGPRAVLTSHEGGGPFTLQGVAFQRAARRCRRRHADGRSPSAPAIPPMIAIWSAMNRDRLASGRRPVPAPSLKGQSKSLGSSLFPRRGRGSAPRGRPQWRSARPEGPDARGPKLRHLWSPGRSPRKAAPCGLR